MNFNADGGLLMRYAIRKSLLWLVFPILQALCFSAVTQSSQVLPPQLDLSAAIRVAVQKNPAMSAAKAQVDISHQRVVQARAGFLPKVDVSESYSRTDNPPPGVCHQAEPGSFFCR